MIRESRFGAEPQQNEDEEELARFMGGFLFLSEMLTGLEPQKSRSVCRMEFCDTADCKSALQEEGQGRETPYVVSYNPKTK